MRYIFLAVGALAAGVVSTCLACNGRGSAAGGPSSGSTGVAMLRSGIGTTGSPFASTGASAMQTSAVQQALLQQLAFQRAMQLVMG